MYLQGLRRLGLLIFLSAMLWGQGVAARNWPFDQRNILLVKTQSRDFPDDGTVAQVLDIFVQRGRVRWVMQKGGRGQIVPIEVPLDFPWQSSVSVKKLGIRYKVDGIVHLQQKGTELDLRWYSVSDGEPMFFEKVNLPAAGPRKEEEDMRRKRLADFLDDIWLRIPGRGYVIRRDMTTVTFEGAAQAGVKVGDVIELRRLEQAERHPLLKTFIGIHSTVSGMATVTAVGDPLSTAKIDYESTADPIQEGDRYELKASGDKNTGKAAVAPTPAPAPGTPAAGAVATPPPAREVIPLKGDSAKNGEAHPEEKKEEIDISESTENDDAPVVKSFLLDVMGRIGWGSLKHSETVSGATKEISGKGPALDLVLRGFVTRNWIIDGKFGLRHYSPEDIDSSYGAGNVGADLIQYRIAAGYRFLFLDDPDIPGECVVSVGYQSYAFSITQLSIAFAPSGKTYSGLDFGISLKVPVWQRIYAFAGGNRIMGASLTESPVTTGNATGSVVWNFDAGIFYRLSRKDYVSLGLDTASSSSSFTGTGERSVPALSNVITSSTLFAAYMHRF